MIPEPNSLAEAFRPLAATAAEFREECAALDQLTESLFSEVERLRQDLERKADELEEGRQRLAERGRQLADQRKESNRLTHLLEQQDAHLTEALSQLRALREQLDVERTAAREREAAHANTIEQRLRDVEADRDQARSQLQLLQSAAGNQGSGGSSVGIESLAPLLTELGEVRRQHSETLAQLAETRTELTGAIERSAASLANFAPAAMNGHPPVEGDPAAQVAWERERAELESELELVRTRATELQNTVANQRRDLVEQHAEVSSELRLLRELVEQSASGHSESWAHAPEPALAPAHVHAAAAAGNDGGLADPVVSSVMAQFAKLQKDVAQRRKKK